MKLFKFRGKRADNGKWIYGDLITSAGACCEISDWNTVDFSRYDVNPDTVGLSTGYLDEKNIEIYEGDIVRCIDMDGEEYKTEVECRDGALAIMVNGCDYDFTTIGWAIDVDVQEIYVIGNIHDNPELLTNN